MHRFKKRIQPQIDFSFISGDDELAYQKKDFGRVLKQQEMKQLSSYFEGKIRPELLQIMMDMLEYNHFFRPTAEQLLQYPIFDEIRIPQNEVTAPYKLVINIDQNDLKLDYEDGKSKYSREQEIEILKHKIIEEVMKFKNVE